MRKLFFMLIFIAVTATIFSYGSINVGSNPTNAVVFIDGNRLGYTPFSYNVVPGFHRVAVQLKGFEPFETYAFIEDNVEKDIRAILRVRKDLASSIGNIIFGITVEASETENWFFENTEIALKETIDSFGLESKVVNGESLDKNKLEDFNYYIDVFLTASEASPSGHDFDLQIKGYTAENIEESFFNTKTKFSVKATRQEFVEGFLPVLDSTIGDFSYKLVKKIYSETLGNIEFYSIDITQFPLISLIFRPIDEEGLPLSLEEIDKSTFTILQNDNPTTPESVRQIYREMNLNFMIALDRSGSMIPVMEQAKNATKEFIEMLPKNNETALMAFGTEIELLKNFTSNKDELNAAIDRINAEGSTPLYDTVIEAIEILSSREGLRFLVLITDGVDANYTDTAFGSNSRLSDAIRLAREKGIPILTIGIGTEIDEFSLGTLALSTGGIFLNTPTIDELKTSFEKLLELFNSSYVLRYEYIDDRNPTMVIDTPERILKGKFFVPLDYVDLELSLPDSVVSGQMFPVKITSRATMTEPLELELSVVDGENNVLFSKQELFKDQSTIRLNIQEDGEFFIELQAVDFFERKSITVLSLESMIEQLINKKDYLEAVNFIKNYLENANYPNSLIPYLLEKLAENQFRAALIEGSVTKLSEFIEISKRFDNELKKPVNIYYEVISYYYIGQMAKAYKKLEETSFEEESRKSIINALFAVKENPEEALGIIEDIAINTLDPFASRIYIESLLSTGKDEQATAFCERLVETENDDPLLLSSIFLGGFYTGNSDLLKHINNKIEPYETLKPLKIYWNYHTLNLTENTTKANNLIESTTEYPNIVKAKILNSNIAAIDNLLEKLKTMDPADIRFLLLLEKPSLDASLTLELPVELPYITKVKENIPVRGRSNLSTFSPFFFNSNLMKTYVDPFIIFFRGYDLHSPLQGKHSPILSIVNANGSKIAELPVDIIYDKVSPTIKVDRFFYTSLNTITIEAEILDDTEVENVLLDGNEVSYEIINGKYSLSYELDRKSKALTLSALDIAGNITNEKIYVIYDVNPPEINIKGRSFTGENQAKLVIEAFDDTGLQFITIQDKRYNADSKKSFEETISIELEEDESKIVKVEAIDLAGNSSSRAFTVEQDNVPPEVEVKLESQVVSDLAEITVIATDISGIKRITVGDIVRDYDNPNHLRETFKLSLNESQDIAILVEDGSGNVSELSRYLYVDKMRPVIEPELIFDGKFAEAVKIIFSDDSGLKYLQLGDKIYKLAGERKKNIPISVDKILEPIKLAAIDIAGRKTERTLKWLKINLNKEFENTVGTERITLSGEIEGPEIENGVAEIMVGDTPYSLPVKENRFNQNIILEKGSNRITITVKSNKGIGGISLEVNYITGQPALKVTLSWSAMGADLDLFVREPGGAIVSYKNRSSREGGYLTTDERIYQDKLHKVEEYILRYGEDYIPPDGKYEIKVHYFDSKQYGEPVGFNLDVEGYGISFEKTATLTYFDPYNSDWFSDGIDWYDAGYVSLKLPDREIPQITADLSEELLSNENIIDYTISASDNKGLDRVITNTDFWGVTEQEYRLYGKKDTTFNEKRYFPEGESLLYIKAVDIYGLTSDLVYNIYVDTTSPKISSEITALEDKVKLILKVSDNHKLDWIKIDSYKIDADGEKEFEIERTFRKDKNEIHIIAQDIAGNISEKTLRW
ncbi:MAG: VWA domain-containing protein [Thermotogota bacterium]|nr:VWA domain-containing protein [Thermotogota bacterium]